MMQRLKTVLIPEAGLLLTPEHIQESSIETDFTRSICHLVGQSTRGSVMLRCSSDGRLLVATAGTALEIYEVNDGVAADAYVVGDTFEFADAQLVTDVLVETFPAQVSFRNAAMVWGDDKTLPVGAYSFDLSHYGIRIQNRDAGDNSEYEITTYR